MEWAIERSWSRYSEFIKVKSKLQNPAEVGLTFFESIFSFIGNISRTVRATALKFLMDFFSFAIGFQRHQPRSTSFTHKKVMADDALLEKMESTGKSEYTVVEKE